MESNDEANLDLRRTSYRLGRNCDHRVRFRERDITHPNFCGHNPSRFGIGCLSETSDVSPLAARHGSDSAPCGAR